MHPKKKPLKKYLFIFIYGCLVFGIGTGLFSSLLIELSYPTPDPKTFFVNFCHRLFVSLPVFMLSGIVFGHWRWASRQQKFQSPKH